MSSCVATKGSHVATPPGRVNSLKGRGEDLGIFPALLEGCYSILLFLELNERCAWAVLIPVAVVVWGERC